jgi:simple sugar transport system substrate-binding protein
MILMLVATGCDDGPGDDSPEVGGGENGGDVALSGDSEVSIIYVNCAPSVGFFATIAKGAEQAASDLGVDLQIVFPDEIAAVPLNQTLQTAVAARPDGIILCGLDPASAESIVAEGVEAGIAFSLTPSHEEYSENPLRSSDDLYISRVGADEFSAGQMAGQTLLDSGVSDGKVLCAGLIEADTVINKRCEGALEVLEAADIGFDKLNVTEDPGQAAEVIISYLRANTDVTGILTPSGGAAEGARAAKNELDLDVPHGAWDLFETNIAGVQEGSTDFLIDQQQFWRGYVPVLDLTHYIRYGLVRANWFLTGPFIVDESNVDAVAELVEQGIR